MVHAENTLHEPQAIQIRDLWCKAESKLVRQSEHSLARQEVAADDSEGRIGDVRIRLVVVHMIHKVQDGAYRIAVELKDGAYPRAGSGQVARGFTEQSPGSFECAVGNPVRRGSHEQAEEALESVTP